MNPLAAAHALGADAGLDAAAVLGFGLHLEPKSQTPNPKTKNQNQKPKPKLSKMSQFFKNDIYMMNSRFIYENGLNTAKLVSVYIPYINCSYDNYAICCVFQNMFGTVSRIDSVYNNSKNPNFKSIFVYYYENNFFGYNRPPVEVQENGTIKMFPMFHSQTEFWLLLPNKTPFPDTMLTLDEIYIKMVELNKNQNDTKELQMLDLNAKFLNEISAFRNGWFNYDTTINVHQLAQNIKLMEDRLQESHTSNPNATTLKNASDITQLGEFDDVAAETTLIVEKHFDDDLKMKKMIEYDEAFRRERDEEDERDRAEEEANYRDDSDNRKSDDIYDEYRDDSDNDYYKDDSDMRDNDDRNDYINDEYY